MLPAFRRACSVWENCECFCFSGPVGARTTVVTSGLPMAVHSWGNLTSHELVTSPKRAFEPEALLLLRYVRALWTLPDNWTNRRIGLVQVW